MPEVYFRRGNRLSWGLVVLEGKGVEGAKLDALVERYPLEG